MTNKTQTNNKQKEAEKLYIKVGKTIGKPKIEIGISQCVGYNKTANPEGFNIISCLKKITLKNSCEESRDLQMCEKCFKRYCNYLEKIGRDC